MGPRTKEGQITVFITTLYQIDQCSHEVLESTQVVVFLQNIKFQKIQLHMVLVYMSSGVKKLIVSLSSS